MADPAYGSEIGETWQGYTTYMSSIYPESTAPSPAGWDAPPEPDPINLTLYYDPTVPLAPASPAPIPKLSGLLWLGVVGAVYYVVQRFA